MRRRKYLFSCLSMFKLEQKFIQILLSTLQLLHLVLTKNQKHYSNTLISFFCEFCWGWLVGIFDFSSIRKFRQQIFLACLARCFRCLNTFSVSVSVILEYWIFLESLSIAGFSEKLLSHVYFNIYKF